MDSETSPPASSSNLCFSRAGQFSLYRFPCATKEHRRVGKTPFSPDDGLNFSAERGTLFLQVLEAAEKLHLCLLSYSLAKWVYVQQRQKFLCIHPVRTVANLNAHRWPCWPTKEGDGSELCILKERKPREWPVSFFHGISAMGPSCKAQSQTHPCPSSTYRAGPNLQPNQVKSIFTSLRDCKIVWGKKKNK